jgi:hypothetical protein
MNHIDDKLQAAERVAAALARGVEARRLHWLSIADRLASTEGGAALVMRFNDSIIAGNEDAQAEAALAIASMMKRENAEFYGRREQ